MSKTDAKAHPSSSMTARDVMRTNVLTVTRSTPLSEVERLLGEHRIGGMPVTDEAGHICGVVSMRDLLERYTQDPDSRPRRSSGSYHLSSKGMDEDLDAYEVPEEAEETVADIMNSDIYSVPAETTVAKVAEKMIKLQVHRILVSDGKKFIGLVTTFDLLGAMAS